MDIETKACPFCGSNDIDLAFSRGFDGGDESKPIISAGCMNCGTCGPDVPVPKTGKIETGYEESAAAWNNRAAPVPEMQIPKQEPAGAVQDDGLTDSTDYVQSIINKSNRASPRITEQDAKRLINNFMFYIFGTGAENGSIDRFLYSEEGRTLLNKLNANAVAEVRQEPAEKILADIKDQQKNAWLAVCKALDEVKPDWLAHGKKGIDCAVEAIRSLSQPARAAAMPKYLSAIEVLRENIRNPDRGVEYCGIFDNDKTRAAIGTLLSAYPKQE